MQSVNVPPQSSVMVAAMGPAVVVRLPMVARAAAMPAHVEAAAVAGGAGGARRWSVRGPGASHADRFGSACKSASPRTSWRLAAAGPRALPSPCATRAWARPRTVSVAGLRQGTGEVCAAARHHTHQRGHPARLEAIPAANARHLPGEGRQQQGMMRRGSGRRNGSIFRALAAAGLRGAPGVRGQRRGPLLYKTQNVSH